MARKKSGISRREFLRRGTAAGLGLAISPSLSGLGWAASKDRVTVLHGTGVDSLHPYNHSSGSIYGLWEHVLEPLVHYDYNQNRWQGRLAESWEFQGKKWVFKLRRGIKFHDGSPFTSKDVVYSMNRMKTDKQSLQRSPFKRVVEVQAPDDYTVIIVTKKPDVTFITRGVRNRHITSKAAAEKLGSDFGKRPPVGTGPYKVVSFQRDGNFVIRRNDDYWGQKPEVKEFIWKKVSEEAARVAGLEAGQGDIIDRVPVHEIPRLERHPRVGVRKVPGLRIYFLVLNPAFKPWDNKLVRQAANYSVDAHSIVKNIYDGSGFVLDGPLGPHVIGYNPEQKRYPYDPGKARNLLAKAGFPNGVDVKLYFSPGHYPKDTELVQVVANQMGKGGFKVELVPQEWVVFWGRSGVNGGKLPFYYIGRGSILDADIMWDQYFRTGVSKRLSYSNPEFDKLIDQEQTLADPEKRVKILQKMGEILMEDVPFIPLYNLADIYGVARDIIWKPRPDEKIHAYEMKVRS